MIQQTPWLVKLYILTDDPQIIISVLIGALANVKSLRRLHFGTALHPEDIQVPLPILPATIEDTTIVVYYDNNRMTDLPKPGESAIPKLPALRKICFDEDEGGTENDMLLPFLQFYSKLTSFDTLKIQYFRDVALRSALATLGIFLSEIFPDDLLERMKTEDTDIATAISHSLRHINFINLMNCEQALCRHPGQLRASPVPLSWRLWNGTWPQDQEQGSPGDFE